MKRHSSVSFGAAWPTIWAFVLLVGAVGCQDPHATAKATLVQLTAGASNKSVSAASAVPMPIVANVLDYGADPSGIRDSQPAFQSAVNAARDAWSGNGGKVMIPAGQYLIGSTVLIDSDNIAIEGESTGSTVIEFAPSAPGTPAFQFKKTPIPLKSDGEAFGNSLRNLSLSGGNAVSKIGVESIDQSVFTLEDLSIHDWSDGQAKESVGLHLQGRDSHRITNIFIAADNPVVIDDDPHNDIDCDHFHFSNLYAIADPSRPVIKIMDGVNVTHLTMDGHQAWVLGSYGLYWVNKKGTIAPYAATFRNVRWEQSKNANGYMFYIDQSAQNPLQSLLIDSAMSGANQDYKGMYLRNILFGSIRNFNWAGQSNAIDVDQSVALQVDGSYFLQGSKIATTGHPVGSLRTYDGKLNLGGVTVPNNQVLIPVGQSYASATSTGGEQPLIGLNQYNQPTIASSGVYTHVLGPLQLGPAAPSSHYLSLPTNSCIGFSNPGSTDTVRGLCSDANNNFTVGTPETNLHLNSALVTTSGTTYSKLGTPVGGTFTYCADCATSAGFCAAGGSGSWAFASAGRWKCPF